MDLFYLLRIEIVYKCSSRSIAIQIIPSRAGFIDRFEMPHKNEHRKMMVLFITLPRFRKLIVNPFVAL
jgi:hypothetical protein